MHWRAARLLAQLPDDTLSRDVEIEVRLHVASCARCRKALQEIQQSEDLLRRIPPSIMPVENSQGAYVRLAALSRWTEEDATRDPEGWRLSFVGMASAALVVCVAASAGVWAPTIMVGPGSSTAVTLHDLPPDYAYVPGNYR